MPYFPEHCHAAELAEAVSGVCEEVDFWVRLGVGTYRGFIGSVDCGVGSKVGWFGVWRRVSCRCGGVYLLIWESHGVVGVGALDGCVYGPLDASFQAGTELRVSALFLAIQSALHEDEFGDSTHPGFTNAERPDARLFVQGNQTTLVNGSL